MKALHCGVPVPGREATAEDWRAFHDQVERNLEWAKRIKQPETPLDADQVAKACCDLAWRNGWVLTYSLKRCNPAWRAPIEAFIAGIEALKEDHDL